MILQRLISISLSCWSLSVASARIFYSQRLGIYREAFPSFKSIAIIWFFIILGQGPFVISIIFSLYTSPYYLLLYVFANWIVSGFVILMHRFIVRRNIDLARNEATENERSKLYFVSCLTSWIAPFTVLSNQPADRSKYLLTIGLSTVVSYIILNGSVLFIEWNKLVIKYEYLTSTGLVLTISLMSLIMLNYLGNYHNIYKLSKYCCFWSPIIHKSMIYDYLVNPELFDLKSEEDFPHFFKTFLKSDQINIPLPQSGNTILHTAYQHARFR